VPPEAVAEATTTNFFRLFRIDGNGNDHVH
jgi:hypothetical protein